MIKLLTFTLVPLFLYSCSTTPANDDYMSEAKAAKAGKAPIVDAHLIPEAPPAPVPPPQSAQLSKQSELTLATASGDDEKIRSVSIDLLQVNSKNYKALNALAMYHYKKRQFEASILLLNKALASNPTSSEVYNNYGLVELAKNEKREAINMFRKALQLNPDNHLAASNVASIYVKEKDYDKVILSLEKSIKNDKASVNSLNNYAIALVGIGRIKEAIEVYEKILKSNPDHKNAMLNYSILLIEKQEKYKEGLDLVNRLKFVGADNESRQVIKDLEIKAKAGLK